MTRSPVTVACGTSLAAARALMEREEIRHLPVVDHGRLMGIVSDRDLFAVDMPDDDDSVPQVDERARRVDDVMGTAVTVISPDDTVVTASVEFQLQKIGCLPVVADDGLVGILTEMDMLTAYGRACRADLLTVDTDVPAVAALMTPDPRCVHPDTPVAEAAELCRALHARHLPVVDDERLAGIVSDRDLRRGLAEAGADSVVGDLMSTALHTIAASARAPEAAALMTAKRISALPVLDGDALVGILTLTDLVDHCMNSLREPDGASSS